MAVIDRIAPDAIEFDHEEIQRYSRHLIMPEVGMAGQRKLKAASVLLIGTGGLGSPLALYLAAAGVGRIGLVDYDTVDYSNLQRQIIHGTKDVGRPKLESAAERISDINPYVQLDLHEVPLTSDNALEILKDYDIIVDGTDNFPTRYLVNDACVMLGKPNVYGSIFRFDGQASVFYAEEGPCYRCLFPEPPPPGLVPSCAEGGVLGVLPGIVGAMQATETIKLIIGNGKSLVGRLILFDALNMTFDEVRLRKNPNCKVCGPNPTVTELIDYEQFCGMPAHDHSEFVTETNGGPEVQEITATELKARMDAKEGLLVLDVRDPHEWDIAAIDGTLRIPQNELLEHLGELDQSREIVVFCRSGFRSANAIKTLKGHGYTKLLNLKGGILAWSDEVDPSLPKY